MEKRSIGPLLLLISLAAAAPRLYLGATQFIEYDGYWHVFIAMQDDWGRFWEEYQANFHPPLYYLLLKLSLWFGRSVLIYRAVSIIAGVAAVFAVGKIAEKLSLWRPTPAIAALAYGLALPSVIISSEVRSYMLCVFFLLVSFYYFLDFVDGRSHAQSRLGFAVFAALAMLSHYSAFFYIFACLVVTAILDVRSGWRTVLNRLPLNLGVFAPVAGLGVLLYFTHTRQHAAVANHLNEFYFQPGGGESVIAFLARNGQYLFNSFSPVEVATPTQFVIVLAGLFLAGGCTMYLIRRPMPENTRAWATVLTTAIILGSIAISGILGKYPFGGYLRQQFILFPFAVLCAGVLLDRSAGAIRNKRLRALLATAIVLLTIGVSSVSFYLLPKVSTEVGTAHASRFSEVFPSPSSVYVDQFNLITFFIHHHDWKWEFVGQNPAVPSLDVYRVSKGAAGFLVVRDRARWNADLADEMFYADLAAAITSQPFASMATFYVRQNVQPISMEDEAAIANGIVELASGAKLCAKKLSLVGGLSAYIELVAGACPAEIDSLTACAHCDDTDLLITFSGNWERGVYSGAIGDTLTQTKQTGATARAAFVGTAVKYVYTKAYNRGLAGIVIDGQQRGIVDLYSPSVEWQASTTFEGLTPGRHTIEIQALGREGASSPETYIDVDAVITP